MASAWLHEALGRAGTKPAATVTPMPRNADRLIGQIKQVQGELVEAQAERGRIENARSRVLAEIGEALAANGAHQEEVATRLVALQSEWAKITNDLGIRAEVLAPPALPKEG